MPQLKDYDYHHHPNIPSGAASIQWYFPNKKKGHLMHPSAPWTDGPAMVCAYDKDGNLIHTRFVNSDGTYYDAK